MNHKMYVLPYTHTHTHTERERQTDTDTQTHTHRQTQTHKRARAHTHTHTMPHITYVLGMMSLRGVAIRSFGFAAVCADADHYKDMEAIGSHITRPIRA